MISRQDVFNDLFKLKKSGVDVSRQLSIMSTHPGIPNEVVKFLIDNSPQFQFYNDLKKNQKVLLKNILSYEDKDYFQKIKICSSLITRMMISIEYKNINPDLLDDLRISDLTKALDRALSYRDFSQIDKVLESHKNSIKLFVKSKEGD